MKMRRHRVFLLCAVGLCVICFLHYVSLLRELSAPNLNIKSVIFVTGFFWKDRPFPLTSSLPDEAHPFGLKSFNVAVQRSLELEDGSVMGGQKNIDVNPWHSSVPSGVKPDTPSEKVAMVKNYGSTNVTPFDPKGPFGSLHQRIIELQDDTTSYFVRTKAGALCFREGTEMAAPKENRIVSSQRRMLQHQEQHQEREQEHTSAAKPQRGKRLVKCVCRPGWHGPYCGVPTTVYHSSLPTKERLTPREVPRRIVNAININHEFDLLHVRFHELARAVDLFLVCESNFTAYGDERPLQFLRLLLNGTYDYVRHKILYIFLDHFPQGGRQDGWIADDYLRTFLTRNGMSRVRGLRPDDVFIINDADEIPAQDGVLFLKLFDGWTEPFSIHMRKSLYGFFWKQPGSLEVLSGCTVRMLAAVYDGDGIKLRRREYFTMPGFRKYENETGHILVQWSIGSPVHFAGWHCSWCFTPEGILHKLISAQNGDFPRWGDYEDKRDLSYIQELIRTGGWFDGTLQQYPLSEPREPMYAPKYLLENHARYRYLLENPYA